MGEGLKYIEDLKEAGTCEDEANRKDSTSRPQRHIDLVFDKNQNDLCCCEIPLNAKQQMGSKVQVVFEVGYGQDSTEVEA